MNNVTHIPVTICGAFGRMGRACIELALITPERIFIRGATARLGSKERKPEHWKFEILEEPLFTGPQVLIDFSHSSLALKHLDLAKKNKWSIVIGTTGHIQENLDAMREAAEYIPVLYAPNTSIMANLLIKLSAITARLTSSHAHILDIHHRHKKDAPSGTALAIKKSLDTYMDPKNISVTSLRVADVIGEHTVSFFKENERLELSHKVNNRQIFAEGALIAAEFIYAQRPGLYDMSDVLNLN